MKLFCLLPAFVFAAVDTRTDLSAVAKFGEAQATHNAYTPADAQNQNRGGLAHGTASNLEALVAAGARACSSLTCVHETHHCNHGTKLFATHAAWQARCNSAAFSSVRVTHSCKAADGSLGTASKIMHKCEQAPEDRCLRGHFCAVDTDRTCKCVEQFPHARVTACADQDGPTCKSCAGAHTLQDNKCVLHGGWSIHGACSKACGGGWETRKCNSPVPADGGDFCWGAAKKACNTGSCVGPSFMHLGYEVFTVGPFSPGNSVKAVSAACEAKGGRVVGAYDLSSGHAAAPSLTGCMAGVFVFKNRVGMHNNGYYGPPTGPCLHSMIHCAEIKALNGPSSPIIFYGNYNVGGGCGYNGAHLAAQSNFLQTNYPVAHGDGSHWEHNAQNVRAVCARNPTCHSSGCIDFSAQYELA